MKALLTTMFIAITVYTLAVGNAHGYNLFNIFLTI